MRPGSVVVDIAAESGGNVEGVVSGETVLKHGVHLIGAANLPASVPLHAVADVLHQRAHADHAPHR